MIPGPVGVTAILLEVMVIDIFHVYSSLCNNEKLMLMIRTNIKRTTAVPIRALRRPLEYPISITILVVIVLTPDVKESARQLGYLQPR